MPRFDWASLVRFLAETSSASTVEITEPVLLAGGAIQHNWGFTALFTGGQLAGEHELVLRTDAPTGVPSSLGRVEEFAILKAVHEAGVTVPEPLWACADPEIVGRPFFVMRRLTGTAQGREITTDPALEAELPRITARLGRELAQIQTIRPPRADLAFLPMIDAPAHIGAFRAYLDAHPRPRPVLEWAINWLEAHLPEPLPPVLCHRDFRTGNYLLDGPELTGILDWEFAGWGDPDEDIGWFCCKGWRFARLDREAGGIADRAPFYAGYEAASSRRLDPRRVHFWEILANVRWALIALQQSDRVLLGGADDLSTAIIGRRATECDLELLTLIDPDNATSWNRRHPAGNPAGETPALPHDIRDIPSGLDLLALGRTLLLNELVPLLPPDRHREVRLLATAISIARREAEAGDGPAREIIEELGRLYRGSAPHPNPLPTRGARENNDRPRHGVPSPRAQGEGQGEGQIGDAAAGLFRRFAADLRMGAFALCAACERAARDILWRLTILKLREANPEFLAANGFGE